MKSFAIVSLLAASQALAQSANVYSFEVAPAKQEGGQTIDVMVGMGSSLALTPASVKATKGDIIRFNFLSGTNSVMETTWDSPCTAMDGGKHSSKSFVGYQLTEVQASTPT